MRHQNGMEGLRPNWFEAGPAIRAPIKVPIDSYCG